MNLRESVWQITFLLALPLLLTLFIPVASSENLTLVNVSSVANQCNPEFTQMLKDANYGLQDELDMKDSEIAELKSYRIVTWISLSLALFLSLREIYYRRKEKTMGNSTLKP